MIVSRLINLIVASVLGMILVQGAFAEGKTPLPVIAKGKGEQCVEPTDEMRRNHMDYILHKRDMTMHEGDRTKDHSLKECINCHAQKDATGAFISVTDEGQFCESCHSYAAVSIDCFQCHATKP